MKKIFFFSIVQFEQKETSQKRKKKVVKFNREFVDLDLDVEHDF